tara:strand:+ start:615 stop:974 length:360 start_codon:yes stop_codon:yes gene_type:complete
MAEFSTMNKINNILDNEKNPSVSQCWGKLSKQEKYEKLLKFAENYCEKHSCDSVTKQLLVNYLKQSLERKKLNKKTDIKFNKETQQVEEVYNLIFHKVNKKFTIKKQEQQKKTIKKKNT